MTDGTRLVRFLRGLGVRHAGVVLAHASLSGTGLAPAAVRDALLRVLGPEGTLVTPAFTPENSDTSDRHHALTAHLTDRGRAAYRAGMPPFDPDVTPCPAVGALADCVRSTPGAVRSAHPQTSFAALGPRARDLLAVHDLPCHLGERSPLAPLYALDAQILLFRVGFAACSALHLAEYRLTPPPPTRTYRCVTGDGWVSYEDIELDDGDFAAIGTLLPRGLRTEGEFAGKTCTVAGMRDTVDAARREMSGYRRRRQETSRAEENRVGHGGDVGRTMPPAGAPGHRPAGQPRDSTTPERAGPPPRAPAGESPCASGADKGGTA
ncbi:AAC(3) family N-acetyltransferase [Streptomyces sp. t39]|uniref:AAC(3) family N-acetyltransferase n=1 Tax=Streptomyces sp. t39 TaxID=1828156 RepID=UPI0011CD5D41|nr:AAC(3) family N-acetyltransferase [Streptomyces sp. t39]TXS48211.1 aminoglycoside N(3)-acetyltransferase [Streptomyces sp. t39]